MIEMQLQAENSCVLEIPDRKSAAYFMMSRIVFAERLYYKHNFLLYYAVYSKQFQRG